MYVGDGWRVWQPWHPMAPAPSGLGKMIVGCILRYRQQLAQSMCREQNLQREKVQVELDWQRRCDDVETELHRRTENLVQELTSAREQVCAAASPHQPHSR